MERGYVVILFLLGVGTLTNLFSLLIPFSVITDTQRCVCAFLAERLFVEQVAGGRPFASRGLRSSFRLVLDNRILLYYVHTVAKQGYSVRDLGIFPYQKLYAVVRVSVMYNPE